MKIARANERETNQVVIEKDIEGVHHRPRHPTRGPLHLDRVPQTLPPQDHPPTLLTPPPPVHRLHDRHLILVVEKDHLDIAQISIRALKRDQIVGQYHHHHRHHDQVAQHPLDLHVRAAHHPHHRLRHHPIALDHPPHLVSIDEEDERSLR